MFSKILIANRSEIASRVIRTCSLMGIATVAVVTEHDRESPFVQQADESMVLPAGSTYTDIDVIIDLAERSGASAVHPGYGFLAENAAFATAVEQAGLCFIGPTPATIAAMGSKIEARKIMADAGVPVLAAAELGPHTDAIDAAEGIGYPLLVKASSGGGGKGMRIVAGPSDLPDAIAGASREAEATFRDPTVYLERYVQESRHVEVQIFGDVHGNTVHLYDRECSVQRRFQKVIEEAPAPSLDDDTRHGLWHAAVQAGEAIGYVGAGTVEFIVDPHGGFAFLEMNTRLQVEHTVTEETTGIDLVRMQIEIAHGGQVPSQENVPPVVGHAIEARLYAESPRDDYTPSTGRVERFSVGGDVRVDTGITDGSTITHHYDPMIAKVIAHAPTRNEAAAKLARSLAQSQIHGVDTNRDLLVHALNHDTFMAGTVDTNWLDGVRMGMPERSESSRNVNAVAGVLAMQQRNRETARVLSTIPSGWRNVRSQPQMRVIESRDARLCVRYTVSNESVSADIDGTPVPVSRVYAMDQTSVDMAIDGLRVGFSVHQVGDRIFVDSRFGADSFVTVPRFSDSSVIEREGAMVAATPGKVVAVHVTVGDTVTEGQVVMVLESMKMEHSVVAAHPGRVIAVRYAVGDQVGAGSLLVEIEGEGSHSG